MAHLGISPNILEMLDKGEVDIFDPTQQFRYGIELSEDKTRPYQLWSNVIIDAEGPEGEPFKTEEEAKQGAYDRTKYLIEKYAPGEVQIPNIRYWDQSALRVKREYESEHGRDLTATQIRDRLRNSLANNPFFRGFSGKT